MTKVSYEISAKMHQVRFYEGHPDKYEACFQIFVEANRGILYSLMGVDFYRRFSHLLDSVMTDLKIESIEATVQAGHYYFIKKVLSDFSVTTINELNHMGREFNWIKIERLKP